MMLVWGSLFRGVARLTSARAGCLAPAFFGPLGGKGPDRSMRRLGVFDAAFFRCFRLEAADSTVARSCRASSQARGFGTLSPSAPRPSNVSSFRALKGRAFEEARASVPRFAHAPRCSSMQEPYLVRMREQKEAQAPGFRVPFKPRAQVHTHCFASFFLARVQLQPQIRSGTRPVATRTALQDKEPVQADPASASATPLD